MEACVKLLDPSVDDNPSDDPPGSIIIPPVNEFSDPLCDSGGRDGPATGPEPIKERSTLELEPYPGELGRVPGRLPSLLACDRTGRSGKGSTLGCGRCERDEECLEVYGRGDEGVDDLESALERESGFALTGDTIERWV
jgi:hypothetical protein